MLKILSISVNIPNYERIINVKLSEEQRSSKKRENFIFDQRPHLLTNINLLSTADDIRKNQVSAKKSSANLTQITNVSNNENEHNSKSNTCILRNQQTIIIAPTKSLTHVPIIQKIIRSDLSFNQSNSNKHSTATLGAEFSRNSCHMVYIEVIR